VVPIQDGKKRKTMKMRGKIFLAFIACMVVALSFQTLLFYRSSSQMFYAQAQEVVTSTLEIMQEDLYAFNKSIENSLIKIYNKNDFMRDLTGGVPVDELILRHRQVAYEMAFDVFTPSQNMVALYIYTPEHDLISYFLHAQTPIYSYPEDVFTQLSPQEVEKLVNYVSSDDRTILLTSVYNPNRQINLIRFVMKIYRSGVDRAGYIVCDVDPGPYVSIVEKNLLSEDQIIWIQPIGDKPALVVGPAADSSDFEQISLSIIGASSPYELLLTADSHNRLFVESQRKYEFTAYSLFPTSILELNQHAVLVNALMVVGLIIILFLFLFFLVSRILTRPLTYVVSTMQRIKQGETSLRLKPMIQDEIGILGHEFNDMLDETERLLTQEYSSRLLLNDAKYKALQAQVNPHFLYNTLDTMSGIANAQDCTTVGSLCHALSYVFRYSIDMTSPYATLAEEIAHIRNYAFIMNVRLNRAIRLNINVDGSLHKYAIPRLSIQPLVENAIQHGLKNKRGEKRIDLRAYISGGTLEVWVEDNGVGMDISKLNDRLENSLDDALSKGESIGLDNINARAKLLYGNAYGVSISSEVDEGSCVILRVPVMMLDDDASTPGKDSAAGETSVPDEPYAPDESAKPDEPYAPDESAKPDVNSASVENLPLNDRRKENADDEPEYD